MRTISLRIAFCLCVSSIASFAQTPARKPGLWETTTTMTFQQSPFPPGMTPPANSPFATGPHTTQVCVTQAQIDKYGGPPPASRGECQVTNMVVKPTGMTADMVCTGRTSGKGTVQATWTDGEHAKSKVHFTGTMQAGPSPRPLEWTSESTSTYKGPDCGSVQPASMPDK